MKPTPELTALIEKFSKQAYIPVFDKSISEDMGSRYFGNPWLPDDMTWPENEEGPLSFVLQLDLATISAVAGLPKEGLISLFMGEEDMDDGSDSMVFLLDTSKAGSTRPSPEGVPYEFSPVGIASWKPVVDTPDTASAGETE